MTEKKGRCMCGAVKLNATDVPEVFSTCYCKTCQRWMGSPFRGVSVKFDNLTISGQENIAVFQSSDFAERANCKNCGSAIWYRLTAGKYAGNTSIPVGLLDDTTGLTLNHEYFTNIFPTTKTAPTSYPMGAFSRPRQKWKR